MSIKLEALVPPEGIAIIRTGHWLRLIRPPYILSDSAVLSENSLQDAVLKHGFFASEREFSSWDEVIDFLDLQVVESRRALGKEIPDSIPDADILEVAPEETLCNFLARVEKELIPQGLFDHAENFLYALLASDVLTRYPEVGRKAAKLLLLNKNAKARAEAKVSELAISDARFNSLERHCKQKESTRIAEIIRERHCIFAPVS